MNAHIWELDKCENKNGKLLKSMVDDMQWLGRKKVNGPMAPC